MQRRDGIAALLANRVRHGVNGQGTAVANEIDRRLPAAGRSFSRTPGGALDASGWPTHELTAELLQAQVEGFVDYCRAVGVLPKP